MGHLPSYPQHQTALKHPDALMKGLVRAQPLLDGLRILFLSFGYVNTASCGPRVVSPEVLTALVERVGLAKLGNSVWLCSSCALLTLGYSLGDPAWGC